MCDDQLRREMFTILLFIYWSHRFVFLPFVSFQRAPTSPPPPLLEIPPLLDELLAAPWIGKFGWKGILRKTCFLFMLFTYWFPV